MSILGQPIPVSNLTGTRSIPARNIPASLDTLRFSLDGTNMTNPALHVTLTIDWSPDGVLWASEAVTEADKARCAPFPVIWEFTGGQIDRHTGQPIATYFYETPAFPASAGQQQVRGTITVSGAPLNTTATITATTGPA
jgi:hypothetical protein